MGFRQLRISDVSGDVLEDSDVVTVIVKNHPATDGESKVFDASAKELTGLKPVQGLVELEIKGATGVPSTLFVNHADLAKIVTDEKVKAFDSARGRRSGFRPNGNGS